MSALSCRAPAVVTVEGWRPAHGRGDPDTTIAATARGILDALDQVHRTGGPSTLTDRPVRSAS
jgi:hypothetical protein